MKPPWLNVDVGELPDEDAELYALAHGVSIACGGHAGDRASMSRALDMCKLHRCRAGAHPSYPDREGFGRRAMTISHEEVGDAVRGQCAALLALARDLGVTLSHMKPHGALYHAANLDVGLARAVIAASQEALGALTIVGPASGALFEVSRVEGLAYAREGFADRAVRADGTLVPRGETGALITEPRLAAHVARELAASTRVDTICVHGDSPSAVTIARAVRAELDVTRAGVDA